MARFSDVPGVHIDQVADQWRGGCLLADKSLLFPPRLVFDAKDKPLADARRPPVARDDVCQLAAHLTALPTWRALHRTPPAPAARPARILAMRAEVRTTGRRSRDLVPSFPLPFEPDDGDAFTLRRLIERAVRVELAAASERRAERAMAQVLGAKPGEQAAPAYRPGGRRGPQLPTPEEAVATALEAFQDGLFLVLVDRRQEEDLDAVVALRPDSVVTFVRLIAMVGG